MNEIIKNVIGEIQISLDRFFGELDKMEYVPGDIIIRLKYKYDYENTYSYSNEILEYSGDDGWIWLNDWDEGYTSGGEVWVLGYVSVDDIPEGLFMFKDMRGV